jgi:UDP-N-acetylmuramate--alanine ligase
MHLKKYKLHFVGIGGVGMCGLAELLNNLGAKVSGSDLGRNANVERLEGLGVKCHQGHDESFLSEDTDVLVYSSAVPRNNPELIKAQKLRIPIIPRAEILSEIMNLQRGIAVGGTHGKTTTTSLIGNMLINAGKKPTIVVGGRLDLIKATALLGEGEWMVAEADESDGSFLKLNPEVVVITNIDNDHMDHYKTEQNLERAFFDFAMKVPFYGMAIVCGDDERLWKMTRDFSKPCLTYGFDSRNDYYLEGEACNYKVIGPEGKSIAILDCALSGKHNALNSLAAFLVGIHLGVESDVVANGLKEFKGVGRRLEYLGQVKSKERYDDYAHHPTELKACLQAIREKFPDKKILGCFQPHRYSRTELCWADFLNCFADLDRLVVTDIYAASEKPIEGVNAEKLTNEIKHQDKHYLASNEKGMKLTSDLYSDMDVVITLGAGNVWQLELA